MVVRRDIELVSPLPNRAQGGTWFPKNDEERAAVLRQLDQILRGVAFRNSRRYPALLRFIVETTLEGRGAGINERILGIEVFARAPDYDTNADHVARTAVGEVRKRLAQYYVEMGARDEIRMDIPAGSYAAQFHLRSEDLDIQPPASFEPAPPAPPQVRVGWPRPVQIVLIASLVCNLILAGFLSFKGLGRSGSTLEKFWDPVFGSSGPVLICIGLRSPNGGLTDRAVPSEAATAPNPDYLWRNLAMADVLALARVTRYAGERHVQFRVLDPASTSFSDLRRDPAILIGASNNTWTKQISGQLRYRFLLNEVGRSEGIVDSQDRTKTWVRGPTRSGSTEDFAIVSRLVDPRVEQVVVIIAGSGPHGTEIAGEFVTNAEQIRKIEAHAPRDWAKRNVQLVVSTEVVGGSSGPPKLEATYFW